MASEDLDAMVALKLSSQDIDLIAGETTAPRVMSRRKRQSKSGAKQVPLSVRSELNQEAIAELADRNTAYAHWLRVVLLRLMVKTPALSRVKSSSDYNLSRTCDFLGFENFEDFAEGRTLSQIRTELETILSTWEGGLISACQFPQALESNLRALADVVGLNRIEINLLGLAVLIHTENILDAGCSLLGNNLSGYNIERILAPMLGLAPEQVAHALQRSEKLATSGLLSIDISGQYGLSPLIDLLTPTFASRMLVLQADIRKIVEGFVRPMSPTELSGQDYLHVKTNLDICRALLTRAFEARTPGINILVYGKPGTGKTEFTRVLASELNCQLMEISPTNLAGAPVAPIRRVRNYRIAQAFFQHAPAVILFDECEEVLAHTSPHDPGDDETNVPRKSWINKVLETNSVPTIWISNSIRGFDEAYLRRFSLCFEMPMPSQEQRQKMLAKAFNGAVSSRAQTTMARHKDTTPALLAQTAKVLETISDGMSEPERDGLAIHLMNNTLKAQHKSEIMPAAQVSLIESGFEPSWANSEVDLAALHDSLIQSRSGRLCLYGPPGTGKTAFGQWLAQAMDVPHFVVKASELLSPYLGETEQNMARAFESARQQKALLQFDEVDSFLQDRQKASKQWEITQVNEMLTQMENFQGVFIASTNLFENLDEASLRRFDMAIKFDFLKPESAWQMFAKTCEMLGVPSNDHSLESRIKALHQLTPGDFEQVLRRSRLLRPQEATQVLRALESAVALKKSSGSRPLGFLCTL